MLPVVEPLPAVPWPGTGLPLDAFALLAMVTSVLVLVVVIVGLVSERRALRAAAATPRPGARRTTLRPAA